MGTRRVSLLLSRVGKRISETVSTTHPRFDSDTVLGWLNDTLDELSDVAVGRKWSVLFKRYNISTVVGTQSYALPDNLNTIKDVWWYETSNSRPRPMRFVRPDELIQVESQGGTFGIWTGNFWSLREGKLYLPQNPITAQTDVIQIQYYANIPHIHTGTLAAAAATSATLPAAATLGEVSATNDYYNGSEIYIVSGTGIGEQKSISDYVGDTRVITIAAWTATPTSASTYEIICLLPEQYCELVVLGGVRRAEAILGKVGFHETEYRRLLDQFDSAIGLEQTQQQDYVRVTEQ